MAGFSTGAIVPEREQGRARKKAAATVGVRRRYVSDAKRINPGLIAPASIVFDVPKDARDLILQSIGGLKVRLGDAATIP